MSRSKAAEGLTPQAWLRRSAPAARRPLRMAGLLTSLDVLAGVGFAGGLALAVGALPAGPAAIAPGVALLLASGAARGLLAAAAGAAGADAAALAKQAVRGPAARASLFAPAAERAPMGEVLALTVDAVEALDGWFARFAPARTAASAGPILALLAMAFASPVSAAILVCTFAPFVLVMILAGGSAADASRRQFLALSRLSGLFLDRIRALPIILAFGAEQRTAEEIGRGAQELSRRTMNVLRLAFLSSAALEFFTALAVALIAVYCGFSLLGLLPIHVPETMTLGRAVFVLALAPEAYAPLRRLAAVYHDRQAAEEAADKLMQAPPLSAERRPAPLAAPPALSFQAASVAYPGEDRPALSPFTLSVAPGETVALMGPTGSGKSTILNLLLGLSRLSAGAVLVDGAPLDPEAPPAASWAGQSPVVIPGSLSENIALSRRDASREDIARAAGQSGLGDGASVLERPINERGGGLSGGERRRLGLARALLADRPLMLLDEPTADLDAASEAALVTVIRTAVAGRTALIATHSEAVAALADRVVRLSE